MDYTFTVFTPAYNRSHTLPRVYESLKQQTFHNFEWLIVDDGSTDSTCALVKEWQQEKPFSIRYIWQENGHKKKAFNRGVKEAKGELFLPLDSDDELVPDALLFFYRHWMNIPDKERLNFTGVCGLCKDETNKIVGDCFPFDSVDSDSVEIFYKFHVNGEKIGFNRTDILLKHLFPENVHGHVPEGIVWSRISSQYKTRFINEVLRIYHLNETDSITRNTSAIDSSDGHALLAREILCNESRFLRYNPTWFLKAAANYTRFHLHLRQSHPGNRWTLRGFLPWLLVVLMWPAGVLRYGIDRLKHVQKH